MRTVRILLTQNTSYQYATEGGQRITGKLPRGLRLMVPDSFHYGPIEDSLIREDEIAVAKLPADWFEDSSLETWFPLTAVQMDALRKERDMHACNAVELMRQRDELLEALKEAVRALALLQAVNMQTRDDATKLRELAECRLEAIRITPDIRAAIAKAVSQ